MANANFSTLYKNAHFKATHNSYSGDKGGLRGPIRKQLDSGIRFLELDVHAKGEQFEIGHSKIGDQVDNNGENPRTTEFSAWLEIIAQWSNEHTNHVPITIGLDVKSNLLIQNGVIIKFENLIKEIFKNKLYPAHKFKKNETTIEHLLDRVLVVLSGNAETRSIYQNSSVNKSLFVELKKGESNKLDNNIFYAARSRFASWGQEQKERGKIVRIWEFDEKSTNVDINFPATDDPYSDWYQDYCKRINTIS